MDLEVMPPLSDFELIEKYQAILKTLNEVSESISEKHPYEDVDVSILGYTCTLTAHEIGASIAAQIRTFERLMMQVQDRIERTEGKVG